VLSTSPCTFQHWSLFSDSLADPIFSDALLRPQDIVGYHAGRVWLLASPIQLAGQMGSELKKMTKSLRLAAWSAQSDLTNLVQVHALAVLATKALLRVSILLSFALLVTGRITMRAESRHWPQE